MNLVILANHMLATKFPRRIFCYELRAAGAVLVFRAYLRARSLPLRHQVAICAGGGRGAVCTESRSEVGVCGCPVVCMLPSVHTRLPQYMGLMSDGWLFQRRSAWAVLIRHASILSGH